MSKTIAVTVTNRVGTINSGHQIFSGDVGVDSVAFTYDSEWNSYSSKKAFFTRNGKDCYFVDCAVSGSTATAKIPAVVLEEQGILYFGLLAESSTEKLSTNAIAYSVGNGASVKDLVNAEGIKSLLQKIDSLKGVRSITVTYAASANRNSAPESGYSSSGATTNELPYLWARWTISYTNGSVERLSPVLVSGIKGDKGDKGDRGEKGEKGEKGDPFTYEDFTPDQLASLKGDKGDRGDKGDTGERGLVGPAGNGLVVSVSPIWSGGTCTLTAHIFASWAELTDSEITSLGVIKWYLDGSDTPAGTGKTITRTVRDRETWEVKLEGTDDGGNNVVKAMGTAQLEAKDSFFGETVTSERFHGSCSRSGIEVMHITGKTTQERTNGYQLFDIKQLEAVRHNPIIIGNAKTYFNPDGSYSGFGTKGKNEPTNGYYFADKTLFKKGHIRGNPKITDKPGVYFQILNADDGITNSMYTYDSYAINLTEELLNNGKFRFGIYENEPTLTARSIKPMFYQDGDGTYETFTGGKPGPNPEYPLPLKSFEANKVVCMGKNVAVVSDIGKREGCTCEQLADGTIVLKATQQDAYVNYVYDYGNTKTGGNAGNIIPIPELATKVYLKSFENVFNRCFINFWDKWGHSLGFTSISSEGAATIPADSASISFRVGIQATAGVTYTDKVMVSFEPITEYVPPFYKEITLPEPLVLRSCATGECDEYLGNGKILRRCKEVTYDGTQAWYYDASPRRFRTYMDGYVDDGYSHNNRHVFCDSGISVEYPNSMGDDPEPGTCTMYGVSLFWTPPRNITSVTELYDYLAEHPIKFIYPLYVPVIEEYPMPILPAVDDDVRAFFVSETETEIEWRPCPITDNRLELMAYIDKTLLGGAW